MNYELSSRYCLFPLPDLRYPSKTESECRIKCVILRSAPGDKPPKDILGLTPALSVAFAREIEGRPKA